VRRVPQRTCAACRQIKAKREMLRLVRTPGGGVEIDVSGKKEGRGTYLCRDRACWEKAQKGKQLEHALKGSINQEDLERLYKVGKDLLKELTSG
jgi:predicted RNA-binding protein YlxR (DUF448 family)